ncbi:hypothetical protein DBR32_11940 [Taibaiella sp. KBW10]|uniref:hypothetical protein n=1 Tax=Taibaiella sp. KBW10 TaxID=2153357 RepID=UPI000F5B8074|nr:hypothetical protein [Taibaiella sp. KBW10]RQO30278.1 hypothetical protein DBR32_11940 [Taibaiella sp. KBW10]
MNATDYFQSYEKYFWEWEDDMGVETGEPYQHLISIPNVSVIAYRDYALELLQQIAIDGIPLFGAYVLVLYASSKNASSGFDGVSYYLRNNNQYAYNVAEAVDFLEKVDRIDDKYKKGKNKGLLLQTIFKDCHHKIPQKEAKDILDEVTSAVHLLQDCAVKAPFNNAIFQKEVRVLELLNKRFPTAQAIEKAMAGLMEVPGIAEEIVEETITADSRKDFVQQLIEDPKTFQVGALIKRIWSGLKIPIHQLSPGEQPIGGVSDMTNKGNFDQMLLSEFAYDDDLFLSRIANNETLYIKREIPPEENIFERIILIDSSIKNWGTPKVMAMATAIAITNHPKAKMSCHTVILGTTAREVAFDEVVQVIDGLSVVSGLLDVADTLDGYMKQQAFQKNIEIFFITSAQALKATRLQKILQEHSASIKYVIATEPDGSMDFFRHQKGTKRHIQKIVLPLEELWADKPKEKSVRKKELDMFPLNYDILFPVPKSILARFVLKDAYYVLSSKKNLYRCLLAERNKYSAYRQILAGGDLLFGQISVKSNGDYALCKDEDGVLFLYYFDRQSRLLSSLNLLTKAYKSLTVALQDFAPDQQLVAQDGEAYLFHSLPELCREITIDAESLRLQPIPEKMQLEIRKGKNEQAATLNSLSLEGQRILTNHFLIGINDKGQLMFSNYVLGLYHTYLMLKRVKGSKIQIMAERRHKDIFTFPDGSELLVDTRGMLTLTSSNTSIPKIYIPAAQHMALGLVTSDGVFSGNDYFLREGQMNEPVNMAGFYTQYIQAFINTIVTHGV